MPEEIIETEIGPEDVTETGAGTEIGIVTETEAGTETETVETIIIVPSAEDSLFAISKRLDSLYILGYGILFSLCLLCIFTIIRRSD